MSTVLTSNPIVPRRFENAAEWMAALGNIPPQRILLNPPPGTATEADLLLLVERDKRLCELIDGTLVEKPMGYWEAYIASRINTRLSIYVDDHGLGNVSGADTTLRMPSSGRIRLPDVSFISRARVPNSLKPVPTMAPDLAVEVLSEGNTSAEIEQKLDEYFSSGTRLAWVVDPATRTVGIYHSAGTADRVIGSDGQLEGEAVVEGFTLPVAEIFRNVPTAQ